MGIDDPHSVHWYNIEEMRYCLLGKDRKTLNFTIFIILIYRETGEPHMAVKGIMK